MPRSVPPLLAVAMLSVLPACGDRTDAGFEQARDEAFRLYEAGEDPGAALTALSAAHALRPDAFGVNLRLGRLLADMKRTRKAVDHFELALEARPDDLATVNRLVDLLVELERTDRVLELLPRLRDDPRYAGEALFREAVIANQQGNRARALALVEQAGALPAADAYKAMALHGRFLFEDGEHEAAYARYRTALAGRPDHAEALKGLADACWRLGREEEAARWDEILGLILDLTDNPYVRPPRSASREYQQVEVGMRSDYISAQLAQRSAKLERLTTIHPDWAEGFVLLADLLESEGDVAGACRAVERLILAHGASAEAQALRQRYCGEAPP